MRTGNKATIRGKSTFASGTFFGIAVSSALAVGTISGAGSANASCVSIGGFSLGSGCYSTPTSIAVGLGNATTAVGYGLFNIAIAVGESAYAYSEGTLNLALAGGTSAATTASGTLNVGYAGGTNAYASSVGNLNAAIQQGNNTAPYSSGAYSGDQYGTGGNTANVAILLGGDSYVVAGTPGNQDPDFGPGFGNVAVSIGRGSGNIVRALGNLNSAFNIVGDHTANNFVQSLGVLNNTTNIGGAGNIVRATGGKGGLTKPGLNVAFTLGGSNNEVIAGPGPGAIAGTVGGSDKHATRTGFGINVKGPHAAAAVSAGPAHSSSSTGRRGPRAGH
jgi:hypothetical protein